MKIVGALLATCAVVGVIGLNRRDDNRHLQVTGGRSTISFFPSLLQSNGLKLRLNSTAEGDSGSGEPSSGFKIYGSDLTFTLANGQFTGFDGGEMQHKGGFTLSSSKSSINANDFTIAPSKTASNTVEFRVGSVSPFEFQHARTYYDLKNDVLGIAHMDVVITSEGAKQLGRPNLAGLLVGTLSVFGDAKATDGGGEIESVGRNGAPASANAPLDVALSAMSSLTAIGRLGTFPNGRNGLSMSTTSCNVGTQPIPWFAPMDVRHPVIAMNLYRVSGGRFEQVGWSWLKHGFLSTNSNGCGTCQQPPGGGTQLGLNCSDTYGTGNNSDRNYLGGRDEVNPFTGIWTCQNSYFSNYVNDCVRRNNGSEFSGDPVAHRLEVLDADLGVAGATYYYEAYYISPNDFDKYNNVGTRTATMSWGGSSWSFSTPTAQVQGPAINRWGEMRGTAEPRTEGDVILAVQTTNLGAGMWRYEYAAYNHDLDRQIRVFSIPVPNGATVANIGFRDIDQNATNQWSSVVASNKITWSTGPFGQGTPNPLKYSSTFNFRFDCNVAPVNSMSTLGLFKPGTGTQLTAVTKGPLTYQPISSYVVENGSEFSGNVASLSASDNNYLELGPSATGTRSGSGMTTSMTGPAGPVNGLIVGVESSNTLPLAALCTQRIELWNWTTGAWELLDTRPVTQADSSVSISLTSNGARFVNATSREVRSRIIHFAPGGEVGQRWRMKFDQVGVHFN